MKNQMLGCLAGLSLVFTWGHSASADPFVMRASIGAQSPSSVAAGGTATYSITVANGNARNPHAYLSCIGLPAGATAAFLPKPVLDQRLCTATVTLMITTTASVPDGTYPFTIMSRHGGSRHAASATGTLTVGANQPQLLIGATNTIAPTITSIAALPDASVQIFAHGGQSQIYEVQATESLSAPSWTSLGTASADGNGLLSFIDQDVANYAARFYRLMVTQ